MESILESGKYSDFTITCGGKEWNVHRAIICPQSEYFTKLCENSFKVIANPLSHDLIVSRTIHEAEDSVVELSADVPSNIEKMLEFLYTGQYKVIEVKEHEKSSICIKNITLALENLSTSENEHLDVQHYDFSTPNSQELNEGSIQAATKATPEILRLQQHITMYSLGDRFLIQKLKDLAAERFRSELPAKWTTEHWCLMEDIDENTAPTDRTLRTPIIDRWLENSMELLKMENFRDNIAHYPADELEFLRKHTQKLDQHQNALSSEISALMKKNAKQAEDIAALSLKYEKIKTEKEYTVNMMLLTVNKWDNCRHCSKEFNGRLEEPRYDSSLNIGDCILRCRSCSTKHKY